MEASLFGIGPKSSKSKTPAAEVPALPAPQPDHSNFESVRLIDGEYSPRRNVPAIALASNRRLNLSLPASTGSTSPYLPPVPMQQPVERRLIVGRDISLAGEIKECDQLVVDGTIEATLHHGKRLDITPNGLFMGSANVEDADIAGRFEGDMNVTRLRLRSTARLTGRVRFTTLDVEAGAQITGEFHYVAPAEGESGITSVINFPSHPTAMRA